MNHLDLFSGIGGFSLGIKQAGIKVNRHYYSDIDKYANELFKRRFPDAIKMGAIENVSHEHLARTRIDLLTGGFPCQAFSIAGKRRGFDDTRGTLFFEIARILEDYIKNGKPIPCILLENVKGLLSHDSRRTFTTIYKVLADLNYTLECQVVNTRWFLPQNRERIFIFGRYNGNPSGRKVFPIGKNDIQINKLKTNAEFKIIDKKGNKKRNQDYAACLSGGGHSGGNHSDMDLIKLNQIGVIEKDSEATRVYDTSCARTIKNGGGMGAKTGLYRVEDVNLIARKRRHDTPKQINKYLKKHKDRTISEIAKELELPKTQVEHYFREDKYRAIPSPDVWLQLKKLLKFDSTYDKQVTEIYEKEYEFESSKRVYSSKGTSQTLDTGNTGLYKVYSTQLRNPNRPSLTKVCDCGSKKLYKKCCGVDGGSGVLSKEDGTTYCLDSGNAQAVEVKSKIRRLTPIECERLQGFPDNWTDGQSDTQRYKQCGNAVSVPVIKAIMEKIYDL
tara:strand:- start:2249 stop:3754 length:1506 start_codon:yes stop_codon:yes gene_type:complete